MAELLARHQHHGVAIGRFEPRDRAPHPDRVVQVAPVRSAREAGDDRQTFGQPAKRSTPALQIAAGIEHDAAQPGAELRLTAKHGELLDEHAAHVLRDIVGIGARSGELPGEGVDAVIVPVEQRRERGSIAAHSRGNQPGVRIFSPLRHQGLCASFRPAMPMAQNQSRTPATKLVVVGSSPSARAKSAVRPVFAS